LFVTFEMRFLPNEVGEAWLGIRTTETLTGTNINGYRLTLRQARDGSVTALVDYRSATQFVTYFEGAIPGSDFEPLPEWINVSVVTFKDKLAFFANGRFLVFVDNAEQLGGTLALGVEPGTTADFDTLIIRDTTPHGE
jgi:hypothetical protein